MGIFDFLTRPSLDYDTLKAQKAVVVDVRSAAEFNSGHVSGSKNIPLDQVSKRADEIMKWGKPVIFCCASGNRSGQATSFFKSKGLDCYNGGSWIDVQSGWS